MKTFTFDVKLFATVRVPAQTAAEARALLRDHFDPSDCDGGEWPNGETILFEASVDGGADLVEVDGEAV